MKTLGYHLPNYKDATSFYRGLQPINEMRRQVPDWNAVTLSNWMCHTLDNIDGLFMQRPFAEEHWAIMEMAKAINLKVWIDYDDALSTVMTDNPTFKVYNKESVRKAITNIVSNADIMTVTTEELKNLYAKVNPKLDIRVVPNAFNAHRLLHHRPAKLPSRNPLVLWRGSQTHHRDVAGFALQIVSAAREEKFSKWIWSFIGDNLWFLTDKMPKGRTVLHEGMDVFEYHEQIVKMAPSVMIVPLHDNQFNRCKSNIAWIEASFAGAVTIAPDWEQWRKPGVLRYNTAAEFDQCLRSVLEGQVDIEAEADKSWTYIREHLFLGGPPTKQRLEVYKEIMCL